MAILRVADTLSYYNSERFMVAGLQKKTYMQACNINFENICF